MNGISGAVKVCPTGADAPGSRRACLVPSPVSDVGFHVGTVRSGGPSVALRCEVWTSLPRDKGQNLLIHSTRPPGQAWPSAHIRPNRGFFLHCPPHADCGRIVMLSGEAVNNPSQSALCGLVFDFG